MIQRVSQWILEKRERHFLNQLLKISEHLEDKPTESQKEKDVFSVFLNEFPMKAGKNLLEVLVYKGILSAYKMNAAILFFPFFEQDSILRKISREYWIRYFSIMAKRCRLKIFLPFQISPLTGLWVEEDGVTSNIDSLGGLYKDNCVFAGSEHGEKMCFMNLEQLKNPELLIEAKTRNCNVILLYTKEITHELEVFSNGRALQFDFYVVCISSEKVFAYGPTIWGADKPFFLKKFERKTSQQLFGFQLPLRTPEIGDIDAFQREWTKSLSE